MRAVIKRWSGLGFLIRLAIVSLAGVAWARSTMAPCWATPRELGSAARAMAT